MRLGALIEQHLVTIFLALATAFAGFITGQVTTGSTLKDHDKRLAVLEKRIESSAAYHACATRHIDRLETGAGGAPNCELGGM